MKYKRVLPAERHLLVVPLAVIGAAIIAAFYSAVGNPVRGLECAGIATWVTFAACFTFGARTIASAHEYFRVNRAVLCLETASIITFTSGIPLVYMYGWTVSCAATIAMFSAFGGACGVLASLISARADEMGEGSEKGSGSNGTSEGPVKTCDDPAGGV